MLNLALISEKLDKSKGFQIFDLLKKVTRLKSSENCNILKNKKFIRF